MAFTGAVDEETLGCWWASASLYATAIRQEAYGIGLAEALVAGLPVVASDTRSPRGHPPRRTRRGGPVVRSRCPRVEAASQFADAIAELLSSTDSCDERAARCTLPSAAEIVEQLLETLTAAIVSRP